MWLHFFSSLALARSNTHSLVAVSGARVPTPFFAGKLFVFPFALLLFSRLANASPLFIAADPPLEHRLGLRLIFDLVCVRNSLFPFFFCYTHFLSLYLYT